jgi:ABC-type ATPase involved in cell division
MRALAGVAFQHVAKVYADGTRAVDDLTLEVRDGGFVVIVGLPAAARKQVGSPLSIRCSCSLRQET